MNCESMKALIREANPQLREVSLGLASVAGRRDTSGDLRQELTAMQAAANHARDILWSRLND